MNSSEFSLFSKSNFNRVPECNSFVSEELEAEEDEIRRNEEIKEMMQNAFDDLDDDNQSINTISYFAGSSSGCCNSKTTHSELSLWNCNPNLKGSRTNDLNNVNHIQTENGQGQHQYLAKIQSLEFELNGLKEQFKEEKSTWLNKFFIEEEEKKLAQKKHEETHKLFCKSQVMLLRRENELKEYQEKLELSEQEKNKALEEVKLCELTIEELEQRLISLEKKNHSKEEEVDNLKRKFSSSDEEKFSGFRKEIQNLNEKSALKDKKYQDLELQLQELQQLHKSVIAEKSDVIAKLSSNLETCQAQCQKLMLNSDRILEKNNSGSRQSLPANMRNDSKLFEELFKAYADVKGKSSEIKFLQEQLKSCINQIKSGKEIESQNVEDIRALKEKLIDLEIKNDQLVRENGQLKNDRLNQERETIVDQSDNENTTLNKKLEISMDQCNKLKNMYLEVSTAKETLLFQNQQLQADVDKLKSENSVLNEIVKTLNNDMPLIPVHCDSFAQESMYLEYCPQNNKSKLGNLSINDESDDLKKKLKECEDQLNKNNIQHAKQLEVLQMGIKDYISSTEIQHQQQLIQLEEECAKKISEIESKHHEQFSQFETEFKEEVLRVSTEEIKHLSNIFQKHFDDVSETMTRLKNELEDKTRLAAVSGKQLESAKEELQKRDQVIENLKSKHDSSSKKWKEQINSMNEKHEKSLLEIDKIYTKYKTTRKVAIDLRELLLKYQKFYAQTLNEIQNYLNETLDGKSKSEKSVTKLDFTKEDLIVPNEEINAAIFAIKKQLESLKHCK